MKQLFVISLLFFTTYTAHAVTDEFLIQSLVGNDFTPPTIPNNVAATPVSSSQIDVTWDASSDNFAIGGYQVFRDTLQIATTTLTSFSDTGLLSSTSYAYNIRAFDTSFNFSTSSATATATTLAPPATSTPTTTEPAFGGRVVTQANVEVRNVFVETMTDSVTINFSTNRLSQAEVAWGRTSDFELGFSTGAIFKKEHQIVIRGLMPGSVYESQIQVTDGQGRVALETVRFETSAGPDVVSPANPMNFQAAETENGLQLTWTNPKDEDFAGIRIVSSDQFYPTDIRGGYLVFDGVAEVAVDERSPASDRRFYTIFAYDASGNVSSGAVTEIFFVETDQNEPAIIDDFDVIQFDQDVLTEEDDVTVVDVEEGKKLDLRNVSFSDGSGNVRYFTNGKVQISDSQITRIAVPYEKLPEHLKTIVVRLIHPETQNVFSFLLKVNADKTAYEAVIGALQNSGSYDFTLEVFDFKTKNIERLQAEVVVVQTVFGTDFANPGYRWVIWLLPALVLLFIIWRRVLRNS